MTLVDYSSNRSSSPVPDHYSSPSASASRNRRKRPRSTHSVDVAASDNEPDPKRTRGAESDKEDSDDEGSSAEQEREEDNGEDSNAEREQEDVEAAVLWMMARWTRKVTARRDTATLRLRKPKPTSRISPTDVARIAMHLFLQAEDPDKTFPLPASVCKASRDFVLFLPELGCASKELILHLLTTGGSTRCLSHWWRSRSSAKLKDVRQNAYPKHVPVIDCGCSLEVALWEFFTYKTWKIGPPIPRPLLSYECRDTFMQAMLEILGISGPEALFNDRGTGWRDPVHQLAFKRDMITTWQEQVQHLEDEVGVASDVEMENEVEKQPRMDATASPQASSSKVTLEACSKRHKSRWDP
ncbi:hypothetical protein BDN72DRAFT_861883 [Pluteus cervinus]|uniref:Uncharacterized protein n=1 Tax=Pluteus cervinus TaxID=181527 RepID=A0ACD3AEC8_9AGAR|nr:hypothetical protein BDN72DRAFT_861883 [Pluteus cervinus]